MGDQAVESSRRVHIEKTGVNWTNGWRIYVDRNDSNSYDVGEQIKIFDGLSGTIRVCTNVADFATDIIFRPDGRIVRTGGKELALELEDKGYDWLIHHEPVTA